MDNQLQQGDRCPGKQGKVNENKAKATREIFHPQLQCNFQKLLRCHRQLHGAFAKFSHKKIAGLLRVFSFSCNFSDVAL